MPTATGNAIMTPDAKRLIKWRDCMFRARDCELVFCKIDTDEFCFADIETGEVVAPLDGTFSLGDAEQFFDELEPRIVGKTQKEG